MLRNPSLVRQYFPPPYHVVRDFMGQRESSPEPATTFARNLKVEEERMAGAKRVRDVRDQLYGIEDEHDAGGGGDEDDAYCDVDPDDVYMSAPIQEGSAPPPPKKKDGPAAAPIFRLHPVEVTIGDDDPTKRIKLSASDDDDRDKRIKLNAMTPIEDAVAKLREKHLVGDALIVMFVGDGPTPRRLFGDTAGRNDSIHRYARVAAYLVSLRIAMLEERYSHQQEWSWEIDDTDVYPMYVGCGASAFKLLPPKSVQKCVDVNGVDAILGPVCERSELPGDYSLTPHFTEVLAHLFDALFQETGRVFPGGVYMEFLSMAVAALNIRIELSAKLPASQVTTAFVCRDTYTGGIRTSVRERMCVQIHFVSRVVPAPKITHVTDAFVCANFDEGTSPGTLGSVWDKMHKLLICHGVTDPVRVIRDMRADDDGFTAWAKLMMQNGGPMRTDRTLPRVIGNVAEHPVDKLIDEAMCKMVLVIHPTMMLTPKQFMFTLASNATGRTYGPFGYSYGYSDDAYAKPDVQFTNFLLDMSTLRMVAAAEPRRVI